MPTLDGLACAASGRALAHTVCTNMLQLSGFWRVSPERLSVVLIMIVPKVHCTLNYSIVMLPTFQYRT